MAHLHPQLCMGVNLEKYKQIESCKNKITEIVTNILNKKIWRHYATEVAIELPPVETYNLDPKTLPTSSVLTRTDALALYSSMVEMRRLEKEAESLYRRRLIRGFLHLYNGMEAVAAGVSSMMKAADDVITSYRCHVWAMVTHGRRGEAILAELLGRRTGCAGGKGGSMHLYSASMFGGQAIVAAQVPLGTGLALAHKYKEDGGVAVIALGDGAINQGQCSESFNLANLHSLPVVYVVEDNGYGMGTSSRRSSACAEYMRRAHPGPGVALDGMDVIAVRALASTALEHCRSGKGPIILHARTYRYVGHSMSDPGTAYRSRAEVDHMRKYHDPIQSLRQIMLEAQLATDDELKKIDTKIRKSMQNSVQVALASPEPAVTELTTTIYAALLERPRLTTIVHNKEDQKYPMFSSTKKQSVPNIVQMW